MSEWSDRFGAALDAFGDAYGAAFDWSSNPYDTNKSAYEEVTSRLGRVWKGLSAGQSIASAAIGEKIEYGLNWPLENLVAEPLSAAMTTGSLLDSETFQKQHGAGNWMEAVPDIGAAWSQAREMADERSFGRSVLLAFGTKDILAEQEEIAKMEDGFLFNTVSGTIDGLTSWYADPLSVVGKAGSGARAVQKGFNVGHRAGDKGWKAFWAGAGVGPGPQPADELADSKAVDAFLSWKKGKNGRQIANHPAVAKSAYPSVLAGLLQEADEPTSRLIIAAGYGSKPAYAKLAERRDDLAFRMARAENVLNTAVDFELARSAQYKTFVPKPIPEAGLRQPDPEQIPLFDIGAMPIGKEGKGGKAAKGSKPIDSEGLSGPGGPPGQPFEYPTISGNLPKTTPGRYFVAPKEGAQATGLGGISVPAGPYSLPGPISPETAKELAPWFNGKSDEKQLAKYVEQMIPGMPEPKKVTTAVNQKWFLQYQQELMRQTGPQLELLTAAVGPGGSNPGRGVMYSMTDYAIRSNADLAKADRTLAYDWASKASAEMAVIQPKTFGTPIRVIKDLPLALMRSFTEQRAPSWIDFNRGDSHAGFAAWLSHADVFGPGSKDTYLREYMKAFTPEAKREVVTRAEKSAIEFMAKKYGISDEHAAQLAQESVGHRNKLISQFGKQKENIYAAPDLPVLGVDDDLLPVTSALMEPQVVNAMPMLDLKRYDRVFRSNSETLGAFSRNATNVVEFLDRAHDVFSQVWSFSVLMRLGYTMRTVTDDMLRVVASMGGMNVMGGIAAGMKSRFTAPKAATSEKEWREWAKGHRARALEAVAAGDTDTLRELMQEVTDRHGRDRGSAQYLTGGGFLYRGQQVEGAYAGRGDVFKEIVGGSYDAIARTTKELIEQLRMDHAHWEVKNPGDADHLESWAYAINKQIGKSAIGRKFLEGANADEVERWLMRSAEGRAVRKAIGRNGRDAEALAGTVQAVVDQYVPILRNHDDPFILRGLAAEGKLNAETLEQYFPDVAQRPQVHGPTIDFNLHQGKLRQKVDNIISGGFKYLSQMPTDKLVRHPTFRLFYTDHVKRLIDNHYISQHARPITGDELRAMEHVAREKSLKQMNGLLYDLSGRSNAAHTMRVMTGFFSAWEDSIKRWGQLAVEKPQLLMHGTKIWDAPNNVNLGSTTDEYGNKVPRFAVVDELGRQVRRMTINGRRSFAVQDENGKWVEFDSTLNDKTRIVARLPKWVPGASELGAIEVPKSGLNLILQGDPWWLPGAGPLVQVPISALAAAKPTTFKSVYDWAIPYGPQSMADVMMPAWLKQAVKKAAGVDDPSYAYLYAQIAQTEEMRIRQGLRTRPSDAEFRKEVEDRTQSAFNVRTFVRFFLPFTADYQSPYQLYIDQYQQLRDTYGEDADERFYELYGDDLYIFTMGLSKNNIGVAATAKAWESVEKHKDLIAQNPEYGALIVGPDVQTGTYDQYVHNAQFNEKLSPGSKLTARERRSPMEALKDNQVRLGWTRFMRLMKMVDQYAKDRGLDDKVADQAKGLIGEVLAEQNKEWGHDYTDRDTKAMPHRIEFFTDLVQNQELLKNPMRTDLRVLNEYLKVRQRFVAGLMTLKKQGQPYTLEAGVNEAIADAWASTQKSFRLSDTRFQELFDRYLTNDRLQI